MEVGIFTFAKKHGRDIERCGSSMWRGKWYADNWEEAELYRQGKKYDVVIFQKVWWPEMLDMLKEQSPETVVIMDLCDPEWLSGWWDIRDISTKVDAIVVSSSGLKEALDNIVDNCPVLWIDDRVDLNVFKGMKKKHEGRAKTVGWFGYQGHAYQALDQVMPALIRNDLDLITIAESPIRFYDYEDRMKHKDFDWSTLAFDLMECDILLNPPIVNPLAKFKSKNKTYIPWALGIPVAHNGKELDAYMEEGPRAEEGERVYNLVREEFEVSKSIKQYQDLISELCQNKKHSDRSHPSQ